MAPWRVLVLEDDPLMRNFFAQSVERCDALELVGAVGTLAQAQDWLSRFGLTLDVLLVDLGLPDGSGLDAIRQARRINPECEPLVISMFGDEDNVLSSIEAGALGYIHKDSAPEDIAQTILEMRAGASPISPMIARRVLLKYHGVGGGSGAEPEVAEAASAERDLLSPREHEVLTLIARGFSYQEVAELQGLSLHTVRTHIKRIYTKLAVHSKNEAVFEATRMGLI